MKNIAFFFLACGVLFVNVLVAQPTKVWDKTFGGNSDEACLAVFQATNGCWLLAGGSNSGANGDKTDTCRGKDDIWVMLTDANGNKLWDKTFGGDGTDQCNAVAPAANGGWLLACPSESGRTGDKSDPSRGSFDYWVVRIDADGNKLWDKTFGGDSMDICFAVLPAADGGWLLAGNSSSNAGGDKSETSRGSYDHWVVRIDSSGHKLWDKTFGGNNEDFFSGVSPTTDGGWLLTGGSYSGKSGDKSEASRGNMDYWVVRIDSSGHKLWDKTFGGDADDFSPTIMFAGDGGWLLAGSSTSDANGDKSELSRGSDDYWVVRIDTDGNKLWDKTFGGDESEICLASAIAPDNGWLLTGWSNSGISVDKTDVCRGAYDFWVVRLDSSGRKLWDKTIGGEAEDRSYANAPASEGGWLLAGYSYSDAGDKTEPSRSQDMWIVRLGPDHSSAPRPTEQIFAYYPNPVRDVLHLEPSPKGQVRIRDLTGRLVLTPTSTNGEIEVSGLPAGLYLLDVDGAGLAPVRFVKE